MPASCCICELLHGAQTRYGQLLDVGVRLWAPQVGLQVGDWEDIPQWNPITIHPSGHDNDSVLIVDDSSGLCTGLTVTLCSTDRQVLPTAAQKKAPNLNTSKLADSSIQYNYTVAGVDQCFGTKPSTFQGYRTSVHLSILMSGLKAVEVPTIRQYNSKKRLCF